MNKMKNLVILLALCCGLSTSIWAQDDITDVQLTQRILKKLGHANDAIKTISDNQWELKDGTTIYSSIPYGQDIYGYQDCTPMFIAIKNGVVTSVAPGPNKETASYWIYLEEENLFDSWNGKTIKEAEQLDVDAVTGATYSSMGVINTVRATLKGIDK